MKALLITTLYLLMTCSLGLAIGHTGQLRIYKVGTDVIRGGKKIDPNHFIQIVPLKEKLFGVRYCQKVERGFCENIGRFALHQINKLFDSSGSNRGKVFDRQRKISEARLNSFGKPFFPIYMAMVSKGTDVFFYKKSPKAIYAGTKLDAGELRMRLENLKTKRRHGLKIY